MGNSNYSLHSRSVRSEALGYSTKSVDEVFTQQKKRVMHESMDPKGVLFRESRDSEAHPLSLPVIIGLDVTGSMGRIPHELVKDGLPHFMGNAIQRGLNDISTLFVAIGDHECDRYPLQIGQFESGDEELDMWLTRTYLEGGGGGNAGESYLLAWYFAAFHTRTDAWEKRQKKGYLFTTGDEPNLRFLPSSAVREVMGDAAQGQGFTDLDLLAEAQKMYNVYHIVVLHSGGAKASVAKWKDVLGQNCLTVDRPEDVANVIAQTIIDNESWEVSSNPSQSPISSTIRPDAAVGGTGAPDTGPAML